MDKGVTKFPQFWFGHKTASQVFSVRRNVYKFHLRWYKNFGDELHLTGVRYKYKCFWTFTKLVKNNVKIHLNIFVYIHGSVVNSNLFLSGEVQSFPVHLQIQAAIYSRVISGSQEAEDCCAWKTCHLPQHSIILPEMNMILLWITCFLIVCCCFFLYFRKLVLLPVIKSVIVIIFLPSVFIFRTYHIASRCWATLSIASQMLSDAFKNDYGDCLWVSCKYNKWQCP